ncbi:MAG: macro domain-containing protein [Ruminococcaceae bacterium]|nr:macro domain-containing protein [Oscillospiraceae bacterium]
MPLQIIRQDITKIKCDVIVNPTNVDLLPDGGTDVAIHAAAGPALYRECRKIGRLDVGEVALTPAFGLPCKYVIHTVGPIWEGGAHGERALLEHCYRAALALALEKECESIAFPLISSGLYGFPKDQVLKIAISVISDFLLEHELQVTLAVFDRAAYLFSEKLFRDVTEYVDDRYVSAHSNDLCERAVFRPSPHFTLIDSCDMAHRAQKENASMGTLQSRLKGVQSRSFALTLFRFIDEKGMSDVECYKKANVDKKTFSKIKCNENYRPGKQTVLAFAIALKLDLAQTQELLATVGLTLSRSSKFDIIVEFFIENGNYDLAVINETLFEFDQMLLGC